MSESELKVGLNGTNFLGVPLLDFSEIGSPAKCATDYGAKVFEISCANAASAIDLFSRSATDVHALTAAQTRKAFEIASDQNREFWTLARKLAAEAGEPIRNHFSNVLRQAG